jgi:hypothetical protein
MSRAMNVTISSDEVTGLCAKKNIAISAMETLLSGGTRVVFMNIADAETMRSVFGTKLLGGSVTRAAFSSWSI